MALKHMHLINACTDAFRDQHFLQETVIFQATGKWGEQSTWPGQVQLSSGVGCSARDAAQIYPVPASQVVHLGDPHTAALVHQVAGLPAPLEDLSLQVPTGRADSRNAVYRVHRDVLRLVREYGTAAFGGREAPGWVGMLVDSSGARLSSPRTIRAMSASTLKSMSVDEYLRTEGSSPVKREYVGGFVYALHSPTRAQTGTSQAHADICGNI